MRRWIASLLMAAAWLFASAGTGVAQPAETAEAAAIAQNYVELLRIGEYDEIAKALDPSATETLDRAKLEEVAKHFPRAEPKTIKISSTQVIDRPGQARRYRFLVEHQFLRRLVMTDVILKQRKSGLVVEGLSAIHFDRTVPYRAEQESVSHEFSLTGKTNTHYVFLAAAILFPLLSIVTAILAVFTPISIFKKLFWIPFVLVGFGSATLDWTTGQVMLNPWMVILLSAGYAQEATGPLMLKIGYPLGVMLFWFLRSGWRADAET